MNGKILGYKLIKLFPNCPCELDAIILISPWGNNQHLHRWPEFWEPVYEQVNGLDLNEIRSFVLGQYRGEMCFTAISTLMRKVADDVIGFIANTTFAHDETKNDFIKKYKALIK